MATKKEEIKIDVPLDNVKAKLQVARVMLQKMDIGKTGKNDFAHFDFFQLEDFLPEINEIFAKLGLHSEFNITSEIVGYEEKSTVIVESGHLVCITKTPIIKEMATLVITDILKPDDVEIYEMEVAPVMIGNNSKQNIYQAAGGRNTYYKRYLYMNALEIVESDESDAVLGQSDVNYQQPNMTPYDFMPQQQAQSQFVVNNISQPIKVTTEQGDWVPQQVQPNTPSYQELNQVADTLEQATNEAISNDSPLSVESKMDIMNLVNSKGLDGSKILADFCRENSLKGPNDLLEVHKQPLINMINRIS